MKNPKEFIEPRLDKLSMDYHNNLYHELPAPLQEAIWSIARAEYHRYKDKVLKSLPVGSKKGLPCPYQPITCQGGYCQDCEIYLEKLKKGGVERA